MVCRVQNHAFDLQTPTATEDALLITVDSSRAPNNTIIPKQLTREKFKELLPTSWTTNYETSFHTDTSLQSTDPKFTRKKDGTVEIAFPSPSAVTAPIFPTIAVIEPSLPIAAFDGKGRQVYAYKDPVTQHCYWDLDCKCNACLFDDSDFDQLTRSARWSKMKKKISQARLQQLFLAGDPEVDLLGEPSVGFDYFVIYPRRSPP
ncbi:uncharacterized protein LOC120002603 [Tripterygium wilfordii]|uniref:uncharacterized protein LOC120002603 n=1 Tax=Tripterygium wilfordii TaxID=458696 RepID=UPI0018F835D9|nr:uncharacterized protein LOC120002603 [Tripterygium wilfordii]